MVIFNLLNSIMAATVLAIIAYPIFLEIEKKVGKRNLSAGLTTLILHLLIVFPAMKILQTVTINSERLGTSIAEGATTLITSIGLTGSEIGQFINTTFIEEVVLVFGNLVFQVPGLLLDLTVTFILVFYFLRDGAAFKAYIHNLAVNKRQTKILNGIESILKSVIIGSVFTGIIIGSIGAVAFKILGIEFVFVLSVILAIVSMLPIVNQQLIE